MTKEEAIQSMKEGKKVTHRFFDKHEYLFINSDGFICGESGTPVYNGFWDFRSSYVWSIDWSIFVCC